MPAFVQALLTGNSKTSGTSLVLSGAVPVTAGNDIFVGFACDDGGSSFGITDNLGNTYALVRQEVLATFINTQLWRASNIAGGTLTTITVAWTTALTAKTAIAGEFSQLGPLRTTDGDTGTTPNERYAVRHATQPWLRGEFLIGAIGWEGPRTDDTVAQPQSFGSVIVGHDGTTGGAAASNIFVDLCYYMAPVDGNDDLPTHQFGIWNNQAVRNSAAAGAIYTEVPSLIVIGPTVDV
jgi:hypothetical protein